MSSVVAVLPSIHEPFTEACLASISPEVIDTAQIPRVSGTQREPTVTTTNGVKWTDGTPDLRLIVVWNTPTHNLGCAGTWNLGIDEVLDTGADWLWILSAGVRFGKQGGRDFLGWLADFTAARSDTLGVEAGNDLGWHSIAFPRHVLERIGRFDPIFWPAYFEDNDYSVRIQRAYDMDTRDPGFVGPLWPKVETDAKLAEVAHGIIRSGVEVNFTELQARFDVKWGPDEEYRTPYNDPELDWTHTGGPRVLA